MALICRIQDTDGRGPYRPGFSHNWSEREDGPPSVFEAFPAVIEKAHEIVNRKGGAVGCGFRTLAQASNWFRPSEVLTLVKFGYSLCWMYADEILAENGDQTVFWSKTPLAESVIHKGWTCPNNQ